MDTSNRFKSSTSFTGICRNLLFYNLYFDGNKITQISSKKSLSYINTETAKKKTTRISISKF